MSKALARLLNIMARLRGPDGCPWDREQTFKSIVPSTIEEAYEVAEAIETGDMKAVHEELGDLLLQIAFYAQIASEQGLFDFDSIADGLCRKLIDRHPHVFGNLKGVETSKDVKNLWETKKSVGRDAKSTESGKGSAGILDGISSSLPALIRAMKIPQRLANVGFDWPSTHDVQAKFHEEVVELENEINAGAPKEIIEDELGDVLFTLVNLARHLGIDPEAALRKCNRKVERRWRTIEARLAAIGKTPAESTLEEMETLWNEIKKAEKSSHEIDKTK